MTIKIGSEVTVVDRAALVAGGILYFADDLLGDVFVAGVIDYKESGEPAWEKGSVIHKGWYVPIKALKPVVRYNVAAYVAEGGQALVEVVSHYSLDVAKFDNKAVRTSTILSCDAATGRFETRNSVYMLATA